MPISSLSIFRHPTTVLLPSTSPLSAALLRHVSHRLRFSATTAAARENLDVPPRKPNKNLLKAKDSVKELSSLSRLSPSQARPTLLPSQAIGLVSSAQANFMRVIVEESSIENPIGVELLCVVRAVLKKIRRRVLVGDKVLVGSVDWVDRRGMIEDVLERKLEVADPPVANVDQLLVLFSMDQPKLEPFSLTRFLVEAESTGIPLTLGLNKVELVEEETLLAWKARLRAWGYEPLFCSVDSKYGLNTLVDTLKEQTTVIVGPSGVGKSSLINALRSNQPVSDEWLEQSEVRKWFEDQRVGEVSMRSGRGKHTTRHVSLLPLTGGGYLADTPGFNQPSLIKVTKRSLAHMFPEVRQMLNASEPSKCSFNDCLHLGEPGCLVKGDWERYPYYLQLLDEIKIREEFLLRTLGTKRESDVRYKVGDMGVRQAEPRLELKKHRRQSRKSLNQSILDELDELDEADDFTDIEEHAS
ncbi:small ribosomal subunit biogenesis GTPase RsgA 1, mitochondrial isoform X2 [Magnolia sinica]|uniref:small ribosomal subunit biogenesis GTPase RsgA 1, mitochondrial isoform X2 n=1 Tax=Magnolia sinica TaxID=86752 RepID=UPI00265AB068|nr:small ribosomal subunit biogenesis GTPase RsgA 1, mitochondrial isoform X2 [Magnolia sinica]